MTHRQESDFASVRAVAVGRDVAARWCALAEQRLHHLSEMFETSRWRRYHSEIAFLENIQEAKRAVQTWRALATGGDVAEAAASVTPAFGWSPATMPRVFPREQQAQTVQPKTLQPKAVHIAPRPPCRSGSIRSRTFWRRSPKPRSCRSPRLHRSRRLPRWPRSLRLPRFRR